MGTATHDIKQEFENTSQGILGATVITGRNQDPKAIPVPPGGRVSLSREEQLLTAQAHQRDENSPFRNGLVPVSAPGKVAQDRFVPFDEVYDKDGVEVETTGVEPQPAGEAATGTQAQDEQVGTPEAQEQPETKEPAKAPSDKPAPPPQARAQTASAAKQVGTP